MHPTSVHHARKALAEDCTSVRDPPPPPPPSPSWRTADRGGRSAGFGMPTDAPFIHFMLPDNPSFAFPTAHPIPHVENALLPPRPSSIHIGLAEADPGIAQIGCALPVESGFAQFREREGDEVDLRIRVEATATDEQEDGMECRDPRPSPTTFSLPTSRIILSIYMTIISPTHIRVDDVCIITPPVYTTHTRSLFKEDWEMDILKRALQGREHDFSVRWSSQRRNNGGLEE
ncbi:hypothetical protein DFH08DRAFT_1085735 [Mycena albidolilacea]|uniref:Uncharacterized protein n=1 Tax=Mycena albidolilacea TaxID=1033008 RepID=A0AAD7EGP9_9AGAR|nr:hypothetical protein DFH08DRAFT_1085735 [Mycena albidolilacea]